MEHPIGLHSEWRDVAELMRRQPLQVRQLVRYLLVMSLVDIGRARIVRAQVRKSRLFLSIETVAGEVFYVLRPRISMTRELQLREEVQAVLQAAEDTAEP